MYRSPSLLTGKHRRFIPTSEVALLLQQGETSAFQRACKKFSIESASCLPKYILIASVFV